MKKLLAFLKNMKQGISFLLPGVLHVNELANKSYTSKSVMDIFNSINKHDED